MFFLPVLLLAHSSVVCLDLFRNVWRTSNKENISLNKELSRIDEELRIEKDFIKNMKFVSSQLEKLNDEVAEIRVNRAIDLGKLEEMKAELDEEYVQERAKLFNLERSMENLWFDDDFRVVFDLAMKRGLFTTLPKPSKLIGTKELGEMIKEKSEILLKVKKQCERNLKFLQNVNSKADNMDGILSSINFYEASQDYLDTFRINPDFNRSIDIFEINQRKKIELLDGVREMERMRRINKKLINYNSSEDWKMRLFGFEEGLIVKEESGPFANPILPAKVWNYSTWKPSTNTTNFQVNLNELSLKLTWKYVKYAETVFTYFLNVSSVTGPKPVIESMLDDVKISE